jgi:hypothetical protein
MDELGEREEGFSARGKNGRNGEDPWVTGKVAQNEF